MKLKGGNSLHQRYLQLRNQNFYDKRLVFATGTSPNTSIISHNTQELFFFNVGIISFVILI